MSPVNPPAKKSTLRGGMIVVAAVVIAAGVIAGVLSRNQPAKTNMPAVPAHAKAPAKASGELTFTGLVQARHVITVAAPVSGTVAEVHAEVGQDVYEGEVLAIIGSQALSSDVQQANAALQSAQERVNKLNADILQSKLDSSRAQADASRADSEFEKVRKVYDRQKFLLEQGATPRLVYQKAEKEYQSAKAEHDSLDAVAREADERVNALQGQADAASKLLQRAQEDVDAANTRASSGQVHSPVTGVLIARRADPGALVDASIRDLFTIAVDLNLLDVMITADPGTLATLHPQENAFVFLAETGNQPLPGVISKIEGNTMRVEFTSPDPSIKPGLTAEVKVRPN